MDPPAPNMIVKGDCLEVMRQWPDACVDHCIADPPFGMSKKRGLGWAFSSHVTMEEAWDRFGKDEFFQFNVAWLSEVCRVVKPNGNILVFGTFHNIYQLGFILQNVLDRRVLNSIVWFKPNAQPNITARTLTESTEQIIWAVNNSPGKAKGWTFNYPDAKELAGGKQMRSMWAEGAPGRDALAPLARLALDRLRRILRGASDDALLAGALLAFETFRNPQPLSMLDRELASVWAGYPPEKVRQARRLIQWLAEALQSTLDLTRSINLWEVPYAPRSERKFGKHPSQKPEALLERLIIIATKPGDLVLDSFSGTGTTGVVAGRLGRRWVMIEKDPKYNEVARRRLLQTSAPASR